MTPYEFCEAYIAATRNGESFGWMLEDIHKLTLSHQRMYALIKRVHTYDYQEQCEINNIIAEMEPKK